MKCPKCGSMKSICADSRPNVTKDSRMRRHRCQECGYNYRTIELYEPYACYNDRQRRILRAALQNRINEINSGGDVF